ncbi:unnamed protein product [Anisakis simplex]|uniref:Neuropeptide-Like Protein n=1 Tax=Anisakis simplex TaxID=6269 RepID=A0A0M3K934_ANISI|nr:unnamed protein product [Anisakis simplex]
MRSLVALVYMASVILSVFTEEIENDKSSPNKRYYSSFAKRYYGPSRFAFAKRFDSDIEDNNELEKRAMRFAFAKRFAFLGHAPLSYNAFA